MVDFNGVVVLKYNNTSKYSVIFNSGISVTIEKGGDILQMMLLVPPMLKGKIKLLIPCLICSGSFIFNIAKLYFKQILK